ncbi:MAG: outer membrane lipoprotein carrier protein LolA [Sneathiella sp.]
MLRALCLLIAVAIAALSVSVRAAPLTLKEGEALMGRFEQARYLRGFDKPILSSGQFFLLPGDALIWQTKTPFSNRMVIDGDGLRQGMNGAEVTRLGFKQFPGFKLLRDTLENSLSGNWAPLEEMAGARLHPSEGSFSLRFSPKASGLSLPFAYLNFEIGDFLDVMEIVKSNGDRDVITFSDQRIAPVDAVTEAERAAREKQP